ncbi:MAG: ABC-F family ATP-binding cassette domain-containing protein, partial [Planctomycetaceae bacterium]
MMLLSVRELSRQFDQEPVFRGVAFDVRAGEKIGLVGPNGTGKTTLLKILAGRDEPDTGQIVRHGGAEPALLEQEAGFPAGRTLIEEARAGLAHLYDLQTEAHDLAEAMAAERDAAALDKLHRRYDGVQNELHRLDAYNIDHRVDEVLHGLGFAEDDYGRPLAEFSGGQQNRVLLARLLLNAPAVMLLDEPTNHLDIAATEWLEDHLARSNQAMLLVSHDRYFLDRVTNRILEMHGGRIADYRGNFSAYWRQRDERNALLRKTRDKQLEEIARAEEFVRRNKYGQKHAQAADREKKITRIENELVDAPLEFQSLAMTFGEAARTGEVVIEAVDVTAGYAAPLFRGLTLRVRRGDRVGILGPNGSGKTTLLRVLLGELEPQQGRVRHGTGVKIGYFDQQLWSVDSDLDAIEAVRPPGQFDLTPGQLRRLLARFGVRGDLALQRVGSMSGGEKSKVALTRLAALNVNVLVLDEPTNHLDLWARDSLEEALKAFDGTLLFVSHDRYFLDRIATNVVVLDPADQEHGCWRFYEGNYSQYVAFRRNQRLETQDR